MRRIRNVCQMTLDAAFFIIKCCRDAALSDPTYATRRQWSIIKTRGTRPDGSAWQLNRHLNITRNCMQFAQQQQQQQQECCNKRGGFAASNVGQAPAAEMVGERGRGVLMMRSFEHLLPLGSARKFFSLVELMMSVHSSLRSLFRQGDASSDAMLHTLRREATQERAPSRTMLATVETNPLQSSQHKCQKTQAATA